MANEIEKNNGEIIIYQSEDGKIRLDVRLEEKTVWLTIEQMAELYGKARSTINEHILNAYKEKEIDEAKTMRKIGNSDFSTKPTNYYNLDVIISVGYRVKSIVGTRFRQWATERLAEVRCIWKTTCDSWTTFFLPMEKNCWKGLVPFPMKRRWTRR